MTCRPFLEELAGDDRALDLRRALVDARRPDVTVEVLEQVAALQRLRAVELDALVDDLLRGLGGEELRHRGGAGDLVRAARRAS